ncbi:hypothetical protein JZ751_014703 [Albula glossodonta]|uniref:Uncharacterized protein n=1 Tax=Albula glossodonta TaxID=121402 RepID=A0A8T2MWU9_9TELE|nr:hypothetical protein JZ751_014703 [Albula glossodonta]
MVNSSRETAVWWGTQAARSCAAAQDSLLGVQVDLTVAQAHPQLPPGHKVLNSKIVLGGRHMRERANRGVQGLPLAVDPTCAGPGRSKGPPAAVAQHRSDYAEWIDTSATFKCRSSSERFAQEEKETSIMEEDCHVS